MDYLQKLPPELLLLIASCLDSRSLCKLYKTSKYLSIISSDELLWKDLCSKYDNYEFTISWKQTYRNIIIVNIRDHYKHDDKSIKINSYYKPYFEIICEIQSLEKVYLSSNSIYSLPSSIDHLCNLKILHIKSKNTIYFPNEFNNLYNLERLHLVDCYLDNLQIWNLTKLKTLKLSNNGLKEIPNDVFRLHNLELLNICNSDISYLSPKISNLLKLKKLLLDCNKLSKLPDEIIKLTKLEILDLNNNKFDPFPSSVLGLKNLKSLSISHNGLVSLPHEIYLLSKLKKLDLSYNSFNKIPNDIIELKQIARIDLYQLIPFKLSITLRKSWIFGRIVYNRSIMRI
jgi:hypothetical protein